MWQGFHRSLYKGFQGFGRSKAVDRHGRPRPLYHGTPRVFEGFDPAKNNPESLFGPGFYFTEDPSVASQYAETIGRGLGNVETLGDFATGHERDRWFAEHTGFNQYHELEAAGKSAQHLSLKLHLDTYAVVDRVYERHKDLLHESLLHAINEAAPEVIGTDGQLSRIRQHTLDQYDVESLKSNLGNYVKGRASSDQKLGLPWSSRDETSLTDAIDSEILPDKPSIRQTAHESRLASQRYHELEVSYGEHLDKALTETGYELGVSKSPSGEWRYNVAREVHLPNVRSVYMKTEKPFDLGAPPDPEILKSFHSPRSALPGATNEHLYEDMSELLPGSGSERKVAANRLLRSHGYDSITHVGGGRMGSKDHRVWIALGDAEQIPNRLAPSEGVARLRRIFGEQAVPEAEGVASAVTSARRTLPNRRMRAHLAEKWLSSRVADSAHLAPGRQAAIEGLSHGTAFTKAGSAASRLRRILTAFGSGWRGLVRLHPSVMQRLYGPGQMAVSGTASQFRLRAASLSADLPSARFYQRPAMRRAANDLEQAARWSERTGFSAVALNPRTPRSYWKDIIRHERIHALEDRYPNHPFIRRELAGAPPLEQSVRRVVKEGAGEVLADYARAGPLVEASEALAWGRQADRTFFPRARAAGLQLPLQSRALAAAHTPVIEGLSHGSAFTKTGSLASRLRRLLTAFGSGWRGIISAPNSILPGAAGITLRPEMLGGVIDAVTGLAASNQDPAVHKYLADLKSAQPWAQRTGHGLVVMNRSAPRSMFREYLRHERIHSSHFASLEHPFWEKKLVQAPGLQASITKITRRWLRRNPQEVVEQGRMALAGIPMSVQHKRYAEDTFEALLSGSFRAQRRAVRDVARSSMRMYAGQDAALSSTGFKGSSEVLERIAWGNQANRGFFADLRAAGLRDPRTLAFNPRKVVPSKIVPALAAAHTPVIEGLSHGTALTKTGSWASRLRKFFTAFGSGWRGQSSDRAAVKLSFRQGAPRHDRVSKAFLHADTGSARMPLAV